MNERSYEATLHDLADELEAGATQLEAQADEDEAYAHGSWLMGGSMASSHRADMRRVDDARQWAQARRARARQYRRRASMDRQA